MRPEVDDFVLAPKLVLPLGLPHNHRLVCAAGADRRIERRWLV